jgi:diguanylate cyclase (GGDEF)-like protein
MGLLLAAYFVSLVGRGTGESWPWLDNWTVAGFELTVSGVCIARGLSGRRNATIALILGAGLLAWSVGDLLLAFESAGGATPPVPSWSDVSYLLFYPLAYVGLMLQWRRGVTAFGAATWLDGAVAGLGSAAVCAAFAFRTVVHTAGGSSISVATNLAYPIGDVLLLALVVAASATLPGRKKASWILLATGCALNAAGDTANLFQSATTPSHLGAVLNGIAWPTALLLIALAVWLQPPRSVRDAPGTAPGFVLPGVAAFSALAIVCYGAVQHLSRVALGLGAATLLVAGVRMVLSLRLLRALTAQRHRQAITDALTGLGNRRHLSEFVGTYFDGGDPMMSLAFLYIDLNHFKEINDAFGHGAGDQLLRQLGPRLVTALRPSDLLLRIGGDEFAVVLMDSDAVRAEEVAGRLAARFDEPFVLDVVSVRVGASIGIAVAPGDATDSEGLLRCADAAMYRAKVSGAAFEVYEKQLDQTANRLRLAEELRIALEQDQLVLHYQPQVDLHNAETLAVEALVRWTHPRLGTLAPQDFLPLAEEAGLMRSLTALVLGTAMTQCAVWRLQGQHVEISVNISASNLPTTASPISFASCSSSTTSRPAC